MSRKTIVCFGDSNTWGYDAETGNRYSEEIRWPMYLQSLLGDSYKIIEEGQNGRTIACDDPWEWGTKKGMDYILPMVESHMPFDLLIIMLGSNDLKKKFNLPAGDVAGSLQNMLMKLKGYLKYKCSREDLKILIVSPVHVGEGIEASRFAEFCDGKAMIEKSKRLAFWYAQVADQFECEFFDAATVAKAGDVDCIHMDVASHQHLAEALKEKIIEMF